MMAKSTIYAILLLGISLQAKAQKYSNYFTENHPPINWQEFKETVAPNLPDYFLSEHNDESTQYREQILSWIYAHPKEFDEARMIDNRLQEYVGWAMEADGKNRDEGPFGNPSFVYYPVNEHRPVFINTMNPDQDSLIYNFKTQHWYLSYHQDQYEELYGEIPRILPYPPAIKHPDDFPPGIVRANVDQYYPEFSENPNVFSQYEALYDQQFGANQPVQQK